MGHIANCTFGRTSGKKYFTAVAIIATQLMLGACASDGSQGTLTDWIPGSEKAPQPEGEQTASLPPPGTPVGQRPPQLPSLEELLGRMPKPDRALTQPPILPISGGARAALLLPLSGSNSRIGNAMLNAAELALFDFASNSFEILIRDTKGTPEGAREAARLAIDDGAKVIIGPLLSSSVEAVSAQARAANIPVIAFSSDRRIVGDGIFTMGFFPEDEVRRVVHYAMMQGRNRFALLAPDDPYGAAVLGALNNIATEFGASVVASELYDPQALDFSDPVKRIADFDARSAALYELRQQLEGLEDEVSVATLESMEDLQTIGDPPFDALLVADGGKRLIEVAALLPFFDIDPAKVKILGTGLWDEPGLGSEPALVGGWFAAPDPKLRKDFVAKYKRTFNSAPHRLTTLAYDAMAISVVLARQKKNPYAISRITQPGGFAGRDGVFRFKQNGMVERGLAVMSLGKKGIGVINPAPSTF